MDAESVEVCHPDCIRKPGHPTDCQDREGRFYSNTPASKVQRQIDAAKQWAKDGQVVLPIVVVERLLDDYRQVYAALRKTGKVRR